MKTWQARYIVSIYVHAEVHRDARNALQPVERGLREALDKLGDKHGGLAEVSQLIDLSEVEGDDDPFYDDI